MADSSGSVVLTPGPDGKTVSVTISGVHVMVGDKEIPVTTLTAGGTQTITVKLDAPPPATMGHSVDTLVFWALLIPLALGTVLGAALVVGMICKLNDTMDKLAQMLSEEGTKMSFSRVQAFIFTYVIAFGSLLIIAHTGNFPGQIPDDLAILAGGSLGTYVISKAIQVQGDKSKTGSG
jgi:hypothetical protein